MYSPARLMGFLFELCQLHSYSLPFKGKGTLEAEQRARVGMGQRKRFDPTPIPTFPLKGKGFHW